MNTLTMQPEEFFEIVQKVINLFNKRHIPNEEPCECHTVSYSILFSQMVGKGDEKWIGRISSESLGTHIFKGSWKQVIGDIMRTFRDIELGILEQMMANWIEWYPNMEDHTTIVTLYNEIKDIRGDFL